MAKKIIFPEIEIVKNFPSRISTKIDWDPITNVIEVGELLVVDMELPGVDKEDVSIVIEGNNELVIRGMKAQPHLNEYPVTYHLFEREFGNFLKRIAIDFQIDAEQIKSVMENGVLTIEIPRKKATKITVGIQ
jgi:HSP20 family protein